MNCNFCHKNFNSMSALNYHKKTAKYCLKIQDGKEEIKEYKCDLCDKILVSNQRLNTHILTCKYVKINDEIQKFKKENEIQLSKKIQEKDKEIQEKDYIIEKLEFIKDNYEKNIKKFDELYKEQVERNKELQETIKKLALRAIDKPTNMTTNNSTINKLELNTFLTQENIHDKIQRKFNDNYLSNGIKDVAKFVHEWILKTDDGDVVYACYDRSRLIFKYKDNNGNEVKDPKAIQLNKLVRPGLILKLKEMLVYLTNEFEHLECRRNLKLNIDQKEYDTIKFFKEKASELGFELTDMNNNNAFCNELANLTS